MADIPEHLLQRSKERRKALGLPVPGEEGGEAEAPAARRAAAEAAADAPAAEAPAAAAAASEPATRTSTTESGTKIPAHLLERAKRRRAAAGGGGGGDVAAARHRRRGRRDRDAPRAHRHRPRRSHAAAAHGGQVGLDPADPRRGAGQGAHLAAPARGRVRRRS